MKVRLLEPWRTRLLWLSLALNVFAAPALIATHLMHQRDFGPPGPPSFGTLVERISRSLGPADAEVFRTAMAAEKPWYDMGRQKVEEARIGVAAAFGHTPYDPAQAAAALGTMQDRMRESGSRFDESLTTVIATLSPEGRSRLAETLRRGHK